MWTDRSEELHVHKNVVYIMGVGLAAVCGCMMCHDRHVGTLLGTLDSGNTTLSTTLTPQGERTAIVAAYPNRPFNLAEVPSERAATTFFHIRASEHGTGKAVIEKTVQLRDMDLTNWRGQVASYCIVFPPEKDVFAQGTEYDIVVTVDGLPAATKVEVWVYWVQKY